MINYYNENDPKAAAWLRELIKGGHIANGVVDERSIEDVQPNDIKDFTQCHFFAGIGGWSYALRLAGWPDDRAVWTGSCPCQPFSTAGKGKGFADERHLWPSFLHLCRICKPDRIFGEQVASKLAWLDLVSRDLEAEGYAVGAAIVGAHSVGAPHKRQRLYWVAHAHGTGSQGRVEHRDGADERLAGSPSVGGMADAGGIGCAPGAMEGSREASRAAPRRTDARRSDWSNPDWLPCTDGKARPVEPGTFPLAHGVPGRVGLLRGYGNAIVPQVAAEFVRATMD